MHCFTVWSVRFALVLTSFACAGWKWEGRLF
jgi:hypothetical protein